MNFFYKESKSKKKILWRGVGGDVEGGGARVSEFLLLRIQI